MDVFQVLRCATDCDVQVVRKAQEQLQAWEQQPGFFVTLARLCVANGGSVEGAGDSTIPQDLDAQSRWMAAVYLKNAVTKYWKRSGRQFELPVEEKQAIRVLLLNNFAREPVDLIAVQVAVLIGRISRIDFPHDWPELMPYLIERMSKFINCDGNSIQRLGDRPITLEHKRWIFVQLHVIKEQASRRLMADKLAFSNLTQNIFPLVQQIWNELTTLFFQRLNDLSSAYNALELAHYTLRMLRKLTTYGFSKRHKFDTIVRFFEQLFACLEQCLQCRYELRRHVDSNEPISMLLEKFILKQMKILNNFQDMHGAAFARFVPMSLEFSFQHVFHERAQLIFTGNEINFPNFAIQCINIMKGIMNCCHYTGPASSSTIANEQQSSFPLSSDTSAATTADSFSLSDFFTSERLQYICDKIITHYFLLTRNELEKWDDDPESFAQDDGGERYRYELRPCVENFYLTCFNKYQATMVSVVVRFVEKAQEITLTANSDFKDILLKDAIYNAVGIPAFYFFNEIDFNTWFSAQLLAELRIDSNNFRILRRRIIWLVSEFAPVKFARDLRPLAYEACLHLLRPEEDMSVRLESSRTLCTLISDFDFAPVAFLPYLESIFNALFALLVNAKECETKMTMLSTMSTLVETLSDYIEPIADKLIAYLPLLWKESEEYQMLRCSIIFALQQIVRAIHDIPEPMKPFLYEVIQFSTDVNQPAHIYLIEEGLTLWVAVVENCTALTTPLLNLCRQILAIVKMSFEHLRTIFVLIQAYVLLDAHTYLELYGSQFVLFCKQMYDDIRAEGIVYMLKVIETCLKAEPRHSLELVRPLLPPIFEEVYRDDAFPMVLSMNLMMLARTLLIDQVVFTEEVQRVPASDALEKILDVWITKVVLVKDFDKRKLYSLAFASILTSNNRLVHERFAGIIQNITDTLVDIMGTEEELDENDSPDQEQEIDSKPPKKYFDALVYKEAQDFDTSGYCKLENFEHESHHYDRCRQLSLKDPVHQYALNEYVSFQLRNMRQQIGDEANQRLWQSVDPSVCRKLARYVKIPL